MGDERVSVLEEGDQNKPVVDPKIRGEIGLESRQETKGLNRPDDSTKPEDNADVGEDNLAILTRAKHDCRGIVVVAECRVAPLASGVPDEIHWEAEALTVRSNSSITVEGVIKQTR
jgi:hypothetical protein